MPDSNEPLKLAYEAPDVERPASVAAPREEDIAPGGREDHTDPYAALRYRGFCVYVLGWCLSVVGDQVMEVAIGWDLYRQTHDPMTLGWVGLVTAAPVILLALPAGHIADVFDRRRLILFTQVLWAFCAACLGFVAHLHARGEMSRHSLTVIYCLLALAATAKAMGWPARSALLPALVPTEIFANAVAWNASAFQIAAMAGPALGGLVLAFNSTAAYYIACLCGVSFAIVLLGIRTAPIIRKQAPASLETLVAGVRFVRENQIILGIITLDLFAVLLGGATYLLPVFARDILHVGSVGFGWLRAAPAVGALVMAIFMAHRPPMKSAGRGMLWAVAGFGAATIVFGLSHNFWLSVAMLFLTGVFDNVSVLVRHTLVQVLTPDAMRGRVSAVNNIFIGASNELGGFESGLTARIFGPITSVVGGGIGTILVVLSVAMIWPQVRRFGSLAHARPIEAEEGRAGAAIEAGH